MTRREQSKSDEAAADLKRMRDWSEQPGLDSRSTGDGVERNAKLRQIDAANKNSSRPSDQDWDTVPGADEARERLLRPERRTPGFPAQWGRLAREAANAPEPVEPEPPKRSRWWRVLYAVIIICVVAFGWAYTEWVMTNNGWAP